MAEAGILEARGAFVGLDAAFSIGGVAVAPVAIGVALGIAPLPGKMAAASAAVSAAAGIGLPAVGRYEVAAGARVVWMGQDDWTLVAEGEVAAAAEAGLAGAALCRWQEGSWAALEVSGTGARAVLARLCGLDLREDAFVPGMVAACEVAHMAGHVLCLDDGFEIWVPRSFAGSLLREVRGAAKRVEDRRK